MFCKYFIVNNHSIVIETHKGDYILSLVALPYFEVISSYKTVKMDLFVAFH